MRNALLRAFIGLAITSLGLFAADNSIGTWKRNMEKSKTNPLPANPIKSLTLVYAAADGGVKLTATGEYKDGTPIQAGYTAKYDGKEYPVTGAPWDTISLKQVDANTFTVVAKKTGGKYHTTGKYVISKDGKTMTMTNKGTNAEGQPISSTLVYEKQ